MVAAADKCVRKVLRIWGPETIINEALWQRTKQERSSGRLARVRKAELNAFLCQMVYVAPVYDHGSINYLVALCPTIVGAHIVSCCAAFAYRMSSRRGKLS